MIILYILAGIIGGVLGGMGMGGGTLLIPILTMAFGIDQHLAQAINLCAFIPMAIISIAIHMKNHLVKFKGIGFIIAPAIISSIAVSFVVTKIPSDKLRIYFGIFLVVVGVWYLVTTIIKQVKAMKN